MKLRGNRKIQTTFSRGAVPIPTSSIPTGTIPTSN